MRELTVPPSKTEGSRPELLAPAGSMEALYAAAAHGADAVYLGWGHFHARQGAKNFSVQDAAAAISYCHRTGIRVYLTLNTLVTDRELSEAVETARTAARLGVDAILVQDWGLLDCLRSILPGLPLHASTQMSLFTTGGVRQASSLGITRAVLARECSRDEIAAICRASPIEIEVFIHGALCMCYSGQCAMSALIGGRSGNRGRCAQPCRLPCAFDRLPRGEHVLSLKDNCLAEAIPDLTAMGVSCLKLEGRMKASGYVAAVTDVYARLLRENRGPTAEETQILEDAFSRSGFTDGYWQGQVNDVMFGIRTASGSAPALGTAPVVGESPTVAEVPVWFDCRITAGAPCTLTVRDSDGHMATVTGPIPEPARQRAITVSEVEQRLRKTGGSGYTCTDVQVSVESGLSLRAASINALRRDALTALTAVRTADEPSETDNTLLETDPILLRAPSSEAAASSEELRYTVSVSRREQLTPALRDSHPARIYIPLTWFRTQTTLPSWDTEWCAVLPRVWRDRDEPQLQLWMQRAKALGVTGVLLGNLGHFPLTDGLGLSRYGDFGLNVTNGWSLDFLRKLGLQSACVSFELRGAQIRDMPKPLPTEAIVYGRLPLMITEHDLCRHGKTLVDRTGAAFPLESVFGRRTEIENSLPLYLADKLLYRQIGLRYARLRFTTETPAECADIVQAYRDGCPPTGAFTRGLFFRGVQ